MSNLATLSSSRAPGSIVDAGVAVATSTSLITSVPSQNRTGEASALNLDELLEQAYNRGYADAQHDAGIENDRRRTVMLEALATSLTESAERALEDRVAIVREAERDAVRLAIEIARSIIGHELELAPHPSEDAVVASLHLAPSGDNFIVRVPPGTTLEMPRLVALTNGAPIVVREDPSVHRGDCIVEVGGCRIERQIDQTLDRVRDELERLFRERAARDAAL